MEQPQSQLVYWDKHRIPVNLTLLFSIGVAAFGLFTYLRSGEGVLLILAGIAVGAYSWFTNPREYRIYQDALVVIYGTPRAKVIPFSNVSHLEMRQLATPDRLRVWPVNGRRVVLMARDPEAFHDQLQKALDDFRNLHPELASNQSQQDREGNPENRGEGTENREPPDSF